MKIAVAKRREITTVLALIEELLAELGEEGQEFAKIDREKLEGDIERNLIGEPTAGSDILPDSGRFLALLAKDESGTAIGVLTLSRSFALYAGGEYGVIDEMYVRREHRGQGIGRRLLEAAVAVARQQRWFRLDVAGPEGEQGARAVHFYQKMGFEFTGPKLRLFL